MAFLDNLADDVCEELLRDGPESIAAALGLPREKFSPKCAHGVTDGNNNNTATNLVDHIRATLKDEHFVGGRVPSEIGTL